MAKLRAYKVGLLVERSRAFGRELCEGVITFAQEREDWELHFLDVHDIQRRSMREQMDGFIARVTTDAIADALRKTGKPVVDLYYEKPRPGFAVFQMAHQRIRRNQDIVFRYRHPHGVHLLHIMFVIFG